VKHEEEWRTPENGDQSERAPVRPPFEIETLEEVEHGTLFFRHILK
jgi:hypothetical protein